PPPALDEELPLAERRANTRLRDRHLALHRPLGHLPGHLAADRSDLALELTHPGLARVVGDDHPQRRIAERDAAAREPVALHLARDQVSTSDLQLLFLGVAGELDHFHAVAQRP